MAIDKTLLDQLLAGREPQDLFTKGGLIDDLKKALSERMLAAKLRSPASAACPAAPLSTPVEI